MIAVVTGAAGFIGSNLVDDLLKSDYQVIGVDNLNTGKLSNLSNSFDNPKFKFINHDFLEEKSLKNIFDGVDVVFHFSANADVRFGYEDPFRDFKQNTLATLNILNAMREVNVKKICFSSTGSIYGESELIPTPENAPFPIQTSLYGASKLSSEGFIEAFCNTYGFQAWIFRFVSILGPRYSHGHIKDFYGQLTSNPKKLKVLGNGMQEKSYLHVDDCISGLKMGLEFFNESVNIINLGHNQTCTVKDSISWICDEMKLEPEITYGIERQGWIGDNPLIHLEIEKLRKSGWKPRYSIEQSVRHTIRFLSEN